MAKRIEMPRYHKIALDIASKIANGELNEGDKIYASSSLAGRYAVSSETARRAIHILVDLGIVSTKKGTGITILSTDKALKYVEQNQSISTLVDLKKEMAESVARQKKELDFFNEKMMELVERTENLRSENPFIPYQLVMEPHANHLEQPIGELPLWEYTQATIVAIRRDGNLIISPGPYESFKSQDTIFYFGKVDTPPKVKLFFYGE